MRMMARAETDRIERRDHFRGRPRDRRVEIGFRSTADPGRSFRAAETGDIGLGGAFILCDDPPAIGTAIDVEIRVPSSTETIAVHAEVRWISTEEGARGMGIKFEALDVESLLALSEYFATLPGAAGGA